MIENQKARTKLSVLLLLLLRSEIVAKSLHPSCTLACNSEKKKKLNISAGIENTNSQQNLHVFLLGTELCIPLKIFAGLSKHLPVFLLGTENIVGGWMAILVVVCGKICGKMCGKKSKKSHKKLKKQKNHKNKKKIKKSKKK